MSTPPVPQKIICTYDIDIPLLRLLAAGIAAEEILRCLRFHDYKNGEHLEDDPSVFVY